MNLVTTPAKKIDWKVLLSILWIVVMITMLKADILNGFIPGAANYPHYIFVAMVETLCLLLIIGFAWTWRKTEV